MTLPLPGEIRAGRKGGRKEEERAGLGLGGRGGLRTQDTGSQLEPRQSAPAPLSEDHEVSEGH